ncbi:MAG: DUF3854 domain-containing protein, partial [Bacteroidetes bacterium]|nr:DUF3854 domain-containing protein [Bacteroidota bacterium]
MTIIENPRKQKRTDSWIIEDLKKSGLNPDNILIEPLTSEAELRERLGFTKIKDNLGNSIEIMDVGGYWISYPNARGYYRLKLKHPIQTHDGKVKYLSPKKEMGFGNHSFIIPEVYKIATAYNQDKPIFISEGEKKAQKATLEGFPCIGLPGVWNFQDGEDGLLPELDQLIWKDRQVFIGFDSDITDKHNVRHAEFRLAVELTNRGANVSSIRLPNESDGKKNGLDDYLVRYGKEAFDKVVDNAKSTLELHIEENTNTRLLLKELSKLTNEILRAKILKLIAKREGVSLSAVDTEYQKYISTKKETKNEPEEEFTPEVLEKAKELLMSPNILLLVIAFTKKLGFVGENINQMVLYLAFTSRLLNESISVIIKGLSSSGKSYLVKTLLRLFPEIDVLSFTYVTPK